MSTDKKAPEVRTASGTFTWEPGHMPPLFQPRRERWLRFTIDGREFEGRIKEIGEVVPDGAEGSTMDVTLDSVREVTPV